MSEEKSTSTPSEVSVSRQNESVKKNTENDRNRLEKYFMDTLGVEDLTYGFIDLGYGNEGQVSKTKDVLLKPMLFDCGCIEPPPKVVILGGKETGMAVAAALLSMNVAYNIAICEIDENVSELADFETSIMGPNVYGHGIRVYSKLESIAGAAVVIITRDFGNFAHSGRAAYTDAIDTIQNNLADVTTLVEAVCKMCPDAIIINQVYPTEVSTHWAYSVGTRMKPAWNSSRFIGIGTAVNSARFRRGLSAKLGVSPTDCEAVILGREGQTSVPIWSSVAVAGVKLQDLNEDIGTDNDQDNYGLLHRDSAGMDELLVRHRGEPSIYAPAVIMARLVYAILHNTREVFTICTFVRGCRHGEKQNVFMSLPCVIGRTGVQRIVKQRMSDLERERMEESAKKLYDTYVQFETGNFEPQNESSDFLFADHFNCTEQCTCLDRCQANLNPIDENCGTKCCPGFDHCNNSKPLTVHKIPRQNFRGSGETDFDYRNIWNDVKNFSTECVYNNYNANIGVNLKARSRFQGIIEAHESAACQSNDSEVTLITKTKADGSTLTDDTFNEY